MSQFFTGVSRLSTVILKWFFTSEPSVKQGSWCTMMQCPFDTLRNYHVIVCPTPPLFFVILTHSTFQWLCLSKKFGILKGLRCRWLKLRGGRRKINSKNKCTSDVYRTNITHVNVIQPISQGKPLRCPPPMAGEKNRRNWSWHRMLYFPLWIIPPLLCLTLLSVIETSCYIVLQQYLKRFSSYIKPFVLLPFCN